MTKAENDLIPKPTVAILKNMAVDFSTDIQEQNQVWVVAACFNEEAVICQFIERVVLLPEVAALVLVDDGSSDATLEMIREWQKTSLGQIKEKKVVLI